MEIAFANDDFISLEDFTRWTFQPSGDYSKDCAFGRRLANEFLVWRNDPAFAPALGWAVTSIAALDRDLSGVETGFFHGLNAHLATVEPMTDRPSLELVIGGRSS